MSPLVGCQVKNQLGVSLKARNTISAELVLNKRIKNRSHSQCFNFDPYSVAIQFTRYITYVTEVFFQDQ